MLKRAVAIGLAVLATVPVLAACSKKGGAIDVAKIASAQVDAKKKFTLKVWDYPNGGDFQAFRQAQIDAWKKNHPNVDVQLEILTWAEGGQKMDVALNAGSPPDIYFQTPNAALFDSGLAIPLETFLTDADKQDFTKAALDGPSYGGHTWEFPMWNSMQCWAGNRKILDDAGIDWRKIQKDGWTWDEFYDIAKKLTRDDNGYGKKQFGFLTIGDGEVVSFMMRNAGIFYQYDDSGNWQWKGEKAVSAMTFLRKMVDDGILPKEMADIKSQKMTDMYNNWEAAIYGRVGPYAIAERETKKKDAAAGKLTLPPQGVVDPVLLPFPHAKSEKEVPQVGTAGLYVFRQKNYGGDDKSKLAIDLAHFLTSGDGGPELDGGLPAAKLLVIPARQSSAKLLAAKADQLHMGQEQLDFLYHELSLAVPPKFYRAEITKASGKIGTDVLRPNYQSFWAHEISPQQFVDNVAKGAEGILTSK